MKYLLIAALLLGGYLFFGKSTPPSFTAADVPKAVATERGGYIKKYETDDLFDQHRSIASLAESGVYTVVSFNADDCPLANGLEERIPAFLEARQDVVYKDVRLATGSFTFTSKEEMEAWQQRSDAKIETYHIDFAPKIYVFGPDRKPIVREDSKGDFGFRFVTSWIKNTLQAS